MGNHTGFIASKCLDDTKNRERCKYSISSFKFKKIDR